jgi:2-aminoadipate transaminase
VATTLPEASDSSRGPLPQTAYKHWITHVQTPRTEALLKRAANEDMISFAGGLPADELFPKAEIESAFQETIAEHASGALQYNWAEGYAPLRAQICDFMRGRGIVSTPETILITHGAQQGLDLIGKLLLRQGEPLAIESPTYVPAIQAFEMQRPKFCAITRTSQGLDLGTLRERVRREHPKLFYVVPIGHNPTGSIMDETQRSELLALAQQEKMLLLEDGAYTDLQFDAAVQPMKSLSGAESHVIFLGSVSKILSPGLRVGWIVAPEEIIRKLAVIKQAADLQTASLNQFVLSAYLQKNSLSEHIARCIAFYRERRDCMITALEANFPAQVQWARPASGFSVWVQLPQPTCTEDLLKAAVQHGIAYEPGLPFFPHDKPRNFMRLSFSNQSCERITEGVRRLGALLTKQIPC